MKRFPHSKDFLSIAERIIWFQPPAESLDHPIELLTYAMTYAQSKDMKALLAHVGFEGLAEAIDARLPGIVDARSWAYWNYKIGREPTSLPKRIIPSG